MKFWVIGQAWAITLWARNLHKTAGIIVVNGGEFPRTLAGLSQLPGIGRSTAGAILSIACGQSEPILDGNVKRVLARFHAIGGWSGDSAVASKLWEISAAYTPTANTGAYTQAMMDLGATLCTRGKPKCESCPVATGCRALALDRVNVLPEPKPRKNLPVKQVYFLILQNAGEEILLEKRPPTGIWGGLWSLPEFSDFQQLRDWCMTCNFSIGGLEPLDSQRHTFSHYHLDYTPILAQMTNPINKVMEANAGVWYKPSAWGNLGMPSPIKRLLQQYDTEVNNDKNG